jgi:hypothetical protein
MVAGYRESLKRTGLIFLERLPGLGQSWFKEVLRSDLSPQSMKAGICSMTLRRMALALLVFSVAALGSWRFWHQDSAVQDIAIVQVQQGDLLSAVTATGTVEARRTVDIKYDTQSLIAGLYVKEGDHVAAGETVATMDLRNSLLLIVSKVVRHLLKLVPIEFTSRVPLTDDLIGWYVSSYSRRRMARLRPQVLQHLEVLRPINLATGVPFFKNFLGGRSSPRWRGTGRCLNLSSRLRIHILLVQVHTADERSDQQYQGYDRVQ